MTRATFLNLSALTAILAASVGQSLAQPLSDPNVEQCNEAVADNRQYRHCHVTPRRTYCHTKEQLPINVRPKRTELSELNPDG